MESNKVEELIKYIKNKLPNLMDIENGQKFYSKYYGNITATSISNYSNNVYIIYGFDETTGSPRSCYYPRDLVLVGKEPMLHNVFDAFNSFLFNKSEEDTDYTNIELILSEWDYKKPYLKDQSSAIINYLYNLSLK